MKPFIRKTLLVALITILLIQLYQPARNINNGQVLSTDFVKTYDVPVNVGEILKTSCFDCHSNNTNYPWYSYIQPTRMWLENHINEGKEELNFSEFGNYSKRKQESKLQSIKKQVASGEMPLNSYTLIHRDAKLNDAQKQALNNWIDKIQDGFVEEY